MSENVLVEIEITTRAVFEVSDLWPDGNAPLAVTEADVFALIDRTSSHRRIAEDWFFPTPKIDVRVIKAKTLR